MSKVPNIARQEVTIGTRHRADLLKLSFCHQKGGSKRPAERYFRDLSVWINALRWSDPDLVGSGQGEGVDGLLIPVGLHECSPR